MHSKLIVTAIPSKYKTVNAMEHDSTDFSQQCKHWAAINNVEYIDMDTPFQTFIKNTGQSPFYKTDIHFNAAGHVVAAACVVNYFKK